MIKVSVCVCVCVCVCLICIYPMPSQFSPVRLFATLWTVAFQSPLSMGFSWQEYWSGLPFPPPWDHPNTGTEATSPASSTGRWILYQWVTGEVQSCCMCCAVLSCSVMSDSLHSKDCSLPGSSFHGDSPAKNTGVGCYALLMLLYTSW